MVENKREAERQSVVSEKDREAYGQILDALHAHTGVDFSLYKESAVARRIGRRTGLNHLGSMAQYRDYLLETREEALRLYDDIFLDRMQFFRDGEAFESLYGSVVAGLLQDKPAQLRIWCAACCTGEEAYSLAILLHEYMKEHRLHTQIQIFATDVDERSIQTAQLGIYPKERLSTLPPGLLKSYFTPQDGGYKIKNTIRKYVVFAKHDMLRDAPFSQIDLLTCRNLLIYLTPAAQQRLLAVCYRQLTENGYLFLGSGESADGSGNAFLTVDAKWRIYRKNPTAGDWNGPDGPPDFDAAQNRQSGSTAEPGRRQHMETAVPDAPLPVKKVTAGSSEEQIKQLEEALRVGNEQLQDVVDELADRNAQLRHSNEEMQSTNEEIYSINEELQTVNGEYQNKIDELTKANADFDNLLQNAEVGALYIDHDLCIRKITPIMEQNTGLHMSDKGSLIEQVSFLKDYPQFTQDVKRTLDNMETIEKEVHDDSHRTWLVRLRPYYAVENEEDGVLVTMFDITRRLQAAQYELKLLNDNLPGGVAKMYFDGGLLIEYANQGLYGMAKRSRESFEKEFENHYERVIFPEDWEGMQRSIRSAVGTGKCCHLEYRVRISGEKIGWRMMEALPLEKGKPVLQCIISDITQLKETQRQLDSLLNNIPGGIIRLFYDGTNASMEYISDNLIRLFGYDKENFYRQNWNLQTQAPFLFDRDRVRVKRALDAILYRDEEQKNEYRLMRKDGEWIWVELRSSVVSRTEKGITVQYTVIDTTKKGRAQEQARREKERLDVIVSLTADLIFEYDIRTDTMYYYNQKEDIANPLPVMEHYTEQIRQGDLFHPEDRNILEDFIRQMRGGRTNISAELRKRYGDGAYHWIAIKARSVKDDKGSVSHVIGKTIIIDERKMREEALRRQSELDSLTGLYNAKTVRKRIMARLKEQMAASIVMLDVDHFKQINDSMGHLFGDAVLVAFADEMRNIFPGCIAGRVGGDEFMMYVENLGSEEIVSGIGMLNRMMKKAYEGEQMPVSVSCSAGIAACGNGQELEELMSRADSALYYVKGSCRGTARLYEPFMRIIGSEAQEVKEPIQGFSREVVIQSDDDLILFALEMFEKVPDTKIAIRAVSDRICRFYGVQDILYVRENEAGQLRFLYHWGRGEAVMFAYREFPREAQEWDTLLNKENRDGICVLRQKDIITISPERAKAMLSVRMQEDEEEGFMLFTDWYKDRDWEKEKNGLKRLSNILFKRIRQLETKQQEIEKTNYIISHDGMTDLLNYTNFLIKAQQQLNENPDRRYFLIYSDFSNFQYLNETYGYAEGDYVLRSFGAHLKENCGQEVLLARVTADHFVSLHEGTGMDALREKYNNICRSFCDRINQRYELCKIILVSGISEVDRSQEIFAVNIDNANLARKAVKKRTQTLCIPYSPQMRVQSQIQMEIAANMEGALQNGEFVTYLQPKIELSTGRLAGAEALVRWVKPDGSMIYPDQFVPIFEKNGFITQIDFEVFEQVLKMQSDMIQKKQKTLLISVNFSRQHQENPQLVRQITGLMQEYQVPGKCLEVEVTESMFMYDLGPLIDNIHRLKECGLSVSIDDFGSGYSSLNVLSKVPADVIKLDREFLRDMELGIMQKPKKFLKMMIHMIKQMGFSVIAEGVETREQADMLRAAGCEYVQGFYYAPPMSIEDFKEFSAQYCAVHGVATIPSE